MTLPAPPDDQAQRNHRTHDEGTCANLLARESAVRVNRMPEDGRNRQGHDHGYDHVSETRVESFHHLERSPQQRPDRLRKMPDPFNAALFKTFIGKHQGTIRAREDDAGTAEAEFQAGDLKLAETVRALAALPLNCFHTIQPRNRHYAAIVFRFYPQNAVILYSVGRPFDLAPQRPIG